MLINRFKYVILGVVLAFALGWYVPEKVEESKKDKVILNLIYNVLNSTHFSPQQINDDFSEKVFDHFIDNLDYNKRFFLESDITSLNSFRTTIDDEIKSSELDFFEAAYEKYDSRFVQAQGFYREILSRPFDLTKKESFQTDIDKLEFATDENELKERWRKYLKYRILLRMEESLTDQEKALENDSVFETKTMEEMESNAREKELELLDEWVDNLKDLERIDWIGVYMNSITNIYDPHTQYFPPQTQEDFEISMTGQIEGIGAQLQQKAEYIVISKIITGSPCWKQGDLEVGDKILKVAQGDEEPLDVIGMKVRKAVNFIRGPKGSEVRLTVKKSDGSQMIIPIIRDVVELEATFAKSAVIGEDENKVGYIKLPKFYVNFYKKTNRNCADDVRAEIEKLKAENINGLILDLRNNGGGSLQGVIDIVGLFIDEGPVVQVKSPGSITKVLKDRDKGLAYDGPLVVMVNQYSASASEIFAAAIQDYKRGIIIGGKSTFGKGTVQNVLDMDKAVNFTYNDVKPLGALKLTIQKYYRINGGTPQLKGVEPEIILPDNYNYEESGERGQEYALPYDEIGSAKYDTWTVGVDQYDEAVKNSQKRIAANSKFEMIDEYADWLKAERQNSIVELELEDFRKDQERYRTEGKKYKNIKKADTELVIYASSADMENWTENEEKKEKAENWFKAINKDLYLHEAVAVVEDLKLED